MPLSSEFNKKKIFIQGFILESIFNVIETTSHINKIYQIFNMYVQEEIQVPKVILNSITSDYSLGASKQFILTITYTIK